MSDPTSFNPAIQRIEEILTTGAGNDSRVIPAGYFGWGSFLAQNEDENAALKTLGKPQITIKDGIAYETTGVLSEILNFAQYRFAFVLVAAYHTPKNLVHSEQMNLLKTIATDTHKIRAALGNPGNLLQTSDGTDTGIIDGMVHFVNQSPIEFNREVQLAKVEISFSGIIHLAYN